VSSDLARAWGGAVGTGRIRECPEDFEVEEVLGFEPGGGGEHAWLYVRKRGANTADVAAALARRAGVEPRHVGFSGRKDRNAVTSQWFSVHLPGRDDPDWSAGLGDLDCVIETVCRGPRKLRTGVHRANRFRLRVRGVDAAIDAVERRLEQVRYGGFPNYFGPQRFGRGGENLHRARRALAQPGRRRVPGIQISAARSWLFNRVLDQRVRDGTWCRALPGDALMLAGSRSMFACDERDATAQERLDRGDLDVTGPLWGHGELPVGAAVAAREADWLADEGELRAGLERIGARADRRPLRAPAHELAWSGNEEELELCFVLPRGAFATSLLREVLDVTEVSAGAWTVTRGLQ
jgi:tRNA pseudouridine13 synthase